MKLQRLIIVLTLLVVASCGLDPERDQFGITIAFYNHTNEVYDAKMIIGGLKNGVFIPTDSINISQIKIGGATHPSYFVDENRWKPNFEKIRAIPSERCYFKLKLSNQREEVIKRLNLPDLFSLLLPKEDVFINDYGRILISIRDLEITGRAAEEL
jgi:hypothetical protein